MVSIRRGMNYCCRERERLEFSGKRGGGLLERDGEATAPLHGRHWWYVPSYDAQSITDLSFLPPLLLQPHSFPVFPPFLPS